MDAKELAARLNGREYRNEVTSQDEADAKAAGLVIVFGASDDLVELRGAIYDEIGAYEGTTLRVTPHGLLDRWPEDEPITEEFAREHFKKEAAGVATIKALWAPRSEPATSWIYETKIPHHTFNVMEDEDVYCRGIVFALADVAKAVEGGNAAS